jgi:putative membrane protein
MSRSFKIALGVLGGAVLVLVLLPVFAGSGLFGGSSMMGPGGMMGGWGFFGIIWMLVPLLFLGGLIAVIVWAVTQLASGRHDASSAGVHQQPAEEMLRQRSAEEILRQRFARGEIDAEEYEERRRILNEQHRGEEGPK